MAVEQQIARGEEVHIRKHSGVYRWRGRHMVKGNEKLRVYLSAACTGHSLLT